GRSRVTTTPEILDQLKRAVGTAVRDLDAAFESGLARIVPDGQGGAWIELSGLALCDTYDQTDTFLVFLLPFNLPGADIYPMFVRADLRRRDAQPLGEGFQQTTLSWPGEPQPRPVVQL